MSEAIVVTGAAGMLGQAVVAAARASGLEVHALARAELDVTDPDAVMTAMERHAPDAVVNCAAWTDVDAAQDHPEEAQRLNGDAPGHLARAATAVGARLVHVSTDYVFAGDADRPYVESDPVGPRSVYGQTKLSGEEQVASVGDEHAIVRTAWLYGAGGRNFVDTMLGLADEGRGEIQVVTDQVGCPTWTGHLAGALVEIATRRLSGLLHVAGSGRCTWNELAREVFRHAGLAVTVSPSTSEHQRRAAPRPAWSVLESERADVPRLPDWRDGVAAYLRERVRSSGVAA